VPDGTTVVAVEGENVVVEEGGCGAMAVSVDGCINTDEFI
jgi:hypothetical protein